MTKNSFNKLLEPKISNYIVKSCLKYMFQLDEWI